MRVYCGRDHCRYCMVMDNRGELKCPRLTQEQRDFLNANPPIDRPFDPNNIFDLLTKNTKMNVLKLLRAASTAREPYWNPDGNPVPASFRFIELAGEAGEVANAAKKLLRHQYGLVGGTDDTTNLTEELGDVLISLDLIAREFGIDLWDCVVMKFNKTSDKHGFPVKFDAHGNFFWKKCATCDNKISVGSDYHDGTQDEYHCENCRMNM